MDNRLSLKLRPILLAVLALLFVSCQYSSYLLPEMGSPITSVEDPNKGISRELDGKDLLSSETDGMLTETCIYDYENIPYRKTLKTMKAGDEVVYRTFTAETNGNFKVTESYSQHCDRYAVTDELTGNLVELRFDVNPHNMKGMKPIPDVLVDKLPDTKVDDVLFKDFIQKAPQYGTWELVIGNDRSAWNGSVEYMPQEIAVYMEEAGYRDLDDRDGDGGASYYRYDLGSGFTLILIRFNRFSWGGTQDDMTTVTFEFPTSFAIEELIPRFQTV